MPYIWDASLMSFQFLVWKFVFWTILFNIKTRGLHIIKTNQNLGQTDQKWRSLLLILMIPDADYFGWRLRNCFHFVFVWKARREYNFSICNQTKNTYYNKSNKTNNGLPCWYFLEEVIHGVFGFSNTHFQVSCFVSNLLTDFCLFPC